MDILALGRLQTLGNEPGRRCRGRIIDLPQYENEKCESQKCF